MKKFAKLLICLLLCCTFALSGCSLVQRNTARYLDKTVATVGDTIELSMRDLLNAYNSYGYQYAQMYGYSNEEAIKTTLDQLIERKLVLEEAKKHILIDDATNKVYYLTFDQNGNEVSRRLIYNANVWQNDLLEETYKAINDEIAKIEETVRKELDKVEPESSTEEETEDDASKPYAPFNKVVEYKNEQWSVIYDKLAAEEELMGEFRQNSTGDEEVSQIAYKRYLKTLVNNQKSLGNRLTEKEALQKEIERIYDVLEEDKIISEFEAQYDKSKVINNDFNARVVEYYKNMVESSAEKYALLGETAGYAQYCKDMQEDFANVNYHPYGEKFVQVSHVLIKLSDAQLAEIKDLDNKLATGVIGQQQRDEEYQKVLDKTVVYARDAEGKQTDVKKTVTEVYAEINAELAKYDTVEEKAIAFNKFIYKYGQDQGINNAERYYVVNLDTNVQDQMVKNFADKSRELYAEQNHGGNLGEPVFVSSDNYSGYHIIFNAGGVDNDLNIEQVRSLDYSFAGNLYNKKLMLGSNKTMYDVIYEKLVASDYTQYSESIVDTQKHNIKVVVYTNRLEDLY